MIINSTGHGTSLLITLGNTTASTALSNNTFNVSLDCSRNGNSIKVNGYIKLGETQKAKTADYTITAGTSGTVSDGQISIPVNGDLPGWKTIYAKSALDITLSYTSSDDGKVTVTAKNGETTMATLDITQVKVDGWNAAAAQVVYNATTGEISAPVSNSIGSTTIKWTYTPSEHTDGSVSVTPQSYAKVTINTAQVISSPTSTVITPIGSSVTPSSHRYYQAGSTFTVGAQHLNHTYTLQGNSIDVYTVSSADTLYKAGTAQTLYSGTYEVISKQTAATIATVTGSITGHSYVESSFG